MDPFRQPRVEARRIRRIDHDVEPRLIDALHAAGRVEKGTPHMFRATNERARIYNTHEPALQFDAYFAGLARLVSRGIATSSKPTPRAMLHLSLLMSSFPVEIQSVRPPASVVRVMAWIARRLRYVV